MSGLTAEVKKMLEKTRKAALKRTKKYLSTVNAPKRVKARVYSWILADFAKDMEEAEFFRQVHEPKRKSNGGWVWRPLIDKHTYRVIGIDGKNPNDSISFSKLLAYVEQCSAAAAHAEAESEAEEDEDEESEKKSSSSSSDDMDEEEEEGESDVSSHSSEDLDAQDAPESSESSEAPESSEEALAESSEDPDASSPDDEN
jgi:hypothetical protein